MKYPKQAKELMKLLQSDQEQKQDVGKAFFHESSKTFEARQKELKFKTSQRSQQMLQILEEIGEPSISNIGMDGAQAISVLAVHDLPTVLRRILAVFTDLYERNRDDTYYQAIPSMTDALLVSERKPQRFGTIWLMNKNKEPFLPIVEDFEHVNERRAKYDIEPLRWPNSLAIPESEQPWLKRPLSGLVMRKPTDKEFRELVDDSK